MRFLIPKFIEDWRSIFREGGFRLLLRRKGWRVLGAFFLFYLTRDTLIYIVLPFLAVKGLISCPGKV
ncbi:MAG: hypothetical protein V3U24_00435 [Candidatus Neomarinimicrobiota bacterium]